jgi:hypothetical protein
MSTVSATASSAPVRRVCAVVAGRVATRYSSTPASTLRGRRSSCRASRTPIQSSSSLTPHLRAQQVPRHPWRVCSGVDLRPQIFRRPQRPVPQPPVTDMLAHRMVTSRLLPPTSWPPPETHRHSSRCPTYQFFVCLRRLDGPVCSPPPQVRRSCADAQHPLRRPASTTSLAVC